MVTGNVSMLGAMSQAGSTEAVSSTRNTSVSNSSDFKEVFNSQSNNSKDAAQKVDGGVKDSTKDKFSVSNKSKDVKQSEALDATETAEDVCKQIEDAIKEEFDITDEELEAALSNLSMTITDMLEPGNVMQLMMELSQNDNPLEIITNSSMSELFKSLNTQISDIVSAGAKELNVSKESFADMLLDYDDSIVFEQSVNVIEENEVITENTNMEAEQAPMQQKDEEAFGKETKAVNSDKNEENIMNTVMNRLDSTVREVVNGNEMYEVSRVDADNIMQQIKDAVKVNMSPAQTSMELQLNPENLGKINIQVVAKNGVVTANIATADEAVKRAVELQVNTLKESLNNQGIKVEAVEVTVESHNFFDRNSSQEGNDQSQNNSRKNRRFIFEEDTPEPAVETVEENVNGMVNYRA